VHGSPGGAAGVRLGCGESAGLKGGGMFERFTERARLAIVRAQEEARGLGHGWVGSEHLLLGLARQDGGLAAKALEALGIDREAVLQQVEGTVGRGEAASSGHIPFTSGAKDTLLRSHRESQALGHHYIGTEHLLLGLAGQGEEAGAQLLSALGATPEAIRAHVVRLLDEYQRAQDPPAG
jgi:ATP-dependent Clp protease ATP-binding subunit ClpC